MKCFAGFLLTAVALVLAAPAYAGDDTITFFPPATATPSAVPAAAPVAVTPVAGNAPDAIPVAAPVTTNPAPAALPAEASADGESKPRWYAAISGSVAYIEKSQFSSGFPDDWVSYDFGYGYAIAGGIHVLSDIRWELEVSGREATIKHDPYYVPRPGFYERPMVSTAVMTNVYYDLHNASDFVPYVGAGIGDAYMRAPRFHYGEGWALAYQFMSGISYEFSRAWAVNVGYRYVSGQDVHTNVSGADIGYSARSNNIEAGLRWSFD